MSTYSLEHKLFLKKIKRNKWFVRFSQLLIIIFFLGIWELSSELGYINTFLSSSPSRVFHTFISLLKDNNLWNHVWVTVYETLVSFILASGIGFIIASILWWNKTIAKILDPYLTILNSLPKVALGPLIIIWVGANTNSIIFMALLISTFITIINIYQGFISTDHYFITLMHTFNAKKRQIHKKPLKDQRIVMHMDMTAQKAMEKFRKGVYTTVTVVDHDLKFLGTLGEKEILDAVVTLGPQTTLQRALDS